MEYNTDIEPGHYVMLINKTRYGQHIITRFGEYWQVDAVTMIEDTPSLILNRCIIEEKIRGGKETLVIDSKHQLQVAIEDDGNFDYEQVVYEEE